MTNSPERTLRPPEKVEVERLVTERLVTVVVPHDEGISVASSDPPVIVKPFEVERPAAEMPPENVEVAVEVLRIEPSVMRNPAERARLAKERPPLSVEVAVEVMSSDPPEIAKPPVTPKLEAVTPPLKLEVAEPVTDKASV